MATYTLTPSSWGGTATITDPSNAYTDTTSATYASVAAASVSSKYAYLGGFDFSTIPQGFTITSLTVKVKAQSSYSGASGYAVRLFSDVDGTAFSSSQNLSQTAEVYTLSLTESVETIIGYSSTLCIRFIGAVSNYPMSAYGAEIIVEATPTVTNKVIYGNETLIDLTGDTATASDVASGKTFHLASGVQATGTLSPSVATATTTGSTTRTVSFTVSKEPSWFMMICSDTNQTSRAYRVQHMLYDGTTTTTYYTNNSVAGSIATNTSFGSFTYSSGTLTITVKTAPYLGAADWELYYL